VCGQLGCMLGITRLVHKQILAIEVKKKKNKFNIIKANPESCTHALNQRPFKMLKLYTV